MVCSSNQHIAGGRGEGLAYVRLNIITSDSLHLVAGSYFPFLAQVLFADQTAVTSWINLSFIVVETLVNIWSEWINGMKLSWFSLYRLLDFYLRYQSWIKCQHMLLWIDKTHFPIQSIEDWNSYVALSKSLTHSPLNIQISKRRVITLFALFPWKNCFSKSSDHICMSILKHRKAFF